jgi:hypothetical protein
MNVPNLVKEIEGIPTSARLSYNQSSSAKSKSYEQSQLKLWASVIRDKSKRDQTMQKSHAFSSLIYNCYWFRDPRFIDSKNFVAMAHRSELSLVPIQLRQDYSGLNKKIELTLYRSICSTWFNYELAAGSTYKYSTSINSSLWIYMNISYIFLFVSMLHIFFISHSSETDQQWWSGGSLLCRCISSMGQQLKLHRQLIWTCIN